jgi:uncharacterized protein with PQ loop repeat
MKGKKQKTAGLVFTIVIGATGLLALLFAKMPQQEKNSKNEDTSISQESLWI